MMFLGNPWPNEVIPSRENYRLQVNRISSLCVNEVKV